jgi:hypothetical protein
MATTEQAIRAVEQAFNDIVRTQFPEFCTRAPSYRYFHRRGETVGDQFFWTTEAVIRNGRPRYASGIYHYLKTKKQWKLTRERYHAKRQDAKARALELYKAEAAQ